MSRRSLFNQMNQSEDLSALTNYDEKSVKPIAEITQADPVPHDIPLSSSAPVSQPFSYNQSAATQAGQTFAPTTTFAGSLYGDRAEKTRDQSQPFFSQTAERPMVFALRSEPGAYVYEYSDRLELYRYSPFGGVVLCDKKLKKR